ncbi:MAG: hypothetical protein RLZZ373_3421 [Pseudomonadota bacterium]
MNSESEIERWINCSLKSYEEVGFGLWAIELLEDGRFIGDAGITYQTVENQRILEIGWHIHSEFRSCGYATEAGKACLDFGFTTLQQEYFGSIVDPENPASIKVASRVHARRREYIGKNGTMLLFYSTAPSAATLNLA